MVDSQSTHAPGRPFLPEIRRARYDRLTIYEVSEAELELLARGSVDSIYLDLSIFLLSVAISLTVSLVTSAPALAAVFTVLVALSVIGYPGGLLVLLLWWRERSAVSGCLDTIRRRLPAESTAEPLPAAEAETRRE